MSDHDPLCMSVKHPMGSFTMCDCGTIRLVRADERERIARAIEALRDRELSNRDRFDNDPLRDRESYRVAVRIHAERAQSYDEAARIARNGGRDE